MVLVWVPRAGGAGPLSTPSDQRRGQLCPFRECVRASGDPATQAGRRSGAGVGAGLESVQGRLWVSQGAHGSCSQTIRTAVGAD